MHVVTTPPTPIALRIWWGWLGMIMGLHTYFSFYHSDLLGSSAYQLVYEVAPHRFWGFVSFLSFVFYMYAVMWKHTVAGLVGALLSLPLLLTTSVSVLYFSLQGAYFAIMAACWWLTPIVGNAIILQGAYHRPVGLGHPFPPEEEGLSFPIEEE